MELPEEQHSEWAPSHFARLIQCPPSFHISRRAKGPVGDEALEGTGAHYLLAQCLDDGTRPFDYLGHIIEITEGTHHVRVEVDKRFAEDLTLPVNFIYEFSEREGLHGIEEKINLSFIQDGFFGRCDLWHFSHDGILTVADLKWGRVDVEVHRNVQLILYALGKAFELWSLGHKILWVRLVIIQPRSIVPGPRVKQDMIPGEELAYWERLVRDTIAATQDNNAPFRTGDYCRYCPGLGMCPATVDMLQNAVWASKTDWQQWTPTQIAAILEASTAMQQMIKRAESAAVRLLLEGGSLPSGHQLYTSRKHDQWKDEDTAKQRLFAIYGLSAMRAPTPNQATELGDEGKKISNELRFKPPGEPVLGKKGDSRAPYVPRTIADIFQENTNELP